MPKRSKEYNRHKWKRNRKRQKRKVNWLIISKRKVMDYARNEIHN